jgi:hypothetical protein
MDWRALERQRELDQDCVYASLWFTTALVKRKVEVVSRLLVEIAKLILALDTHDPFMDCLF